MDRERFLDAVRRAGGNNILIRFVADQGRFFDWRPMPEGFGLMALGNCFENSFVTAVETPGLAYCEGLAWMEGRGRLVHHAWCADNRGRVVDVTWAGRRRVAEETGPLHRPVDLDGHDRRLYFGIPVNRHLAGRLVRMVDESKGETIVGKMAAAAKVLGAAAVMRRPRPKASRLPPGTAPAPWMTHAS